MQQIQEIDVSTGVVTYREAMPGEIPPAPVKSYREALDGYNAVFQADVAKYNNAFALTLLADSVGPRNLQRWRQSVRNTKHEKPSTL